MGFRSAMRLADPRRSLVEVTDSDGLDATQHDLVLEALKRDEDIVAIFFRGRRRATLDAFDALGRECEAFVAHDLDHDNTRLLRERRLSAVLHHDLRQDMRRACQIIMRAHKALPDDGPSLPWPSRWSRRSTCHRVLRPCRSPTETDRFDAAPRIARRALNQAARGATSGVSPRAPASRGVNSASPGGRTIGLPRAGRWSAHARAEPARGLRAPGRRVTVGRRGARRHAAAGARTAVVTATWAADTGGPRSSAPKPCGSSAPANRACSATPMRVYRTRLRAVCGSARRRSTRRCGGW